MTDLNLSVFLNLDGTRLKVGSLWQKERIYFQYDPSFLNKGFDISPFKLPLQEGVFEEPSTIFNGLFGLFYDAMGDSYVRFMLDIDLQKENLLPVYFKPKPYNSLMDIHQTFGNIFSDTPSFFPSLLGNKLQGYTPDRPNPLHHLAMLGDNALGALEYRLETPEMSFLTTKARDSFGHPLVPKEGSVSKLLEKIYRHLPLHPKARPKITALISKDKKKIAFGVREKEEFDPWIIKFRARTDFPNVGATEYAYSLIAERAGLPVVESHLFPASGSPGYFGCKRFDRQGGFKVHTQNVSSLIGEDYHTFFSYEELINMTLLLTKSEKEAEKIVRLMILNVFLKNRDDNIKNVSFCMTKSGKWEVAPFYDIAPTLAPVHSLTLNGKREDFDTQDFLEAAAHAHLTGQKTLEIIEQTQDAVSWLPKVFKRLGIHL